MTEKKEVLMVLARKHVFKEQPLPKAYQYVQDGAAIVLDAKLNTVGQASLVMQEEFPDYPDRKKVELWVHPDHKCRGIEEAVLSKLAMEYDKTVSRYPLYIRLDGSDLDLVRCLARFGWTPYLGCWKGHGQAQSEKDWEEITARLRQGQQP